MVIYRKHQELAQTCEMTLSTRRGSRILVFYRETDQQDVPADMPPFVLHQLHQLSSCSSSDPKSNHANICKLRRFRQIFPYNDAGKDFVRRSAHLLTVDNEHWTIG